ncbi:hypothetical protein [Soonwooa sp.]|uniref:hypothetical protein n=1 Tax=Soonwooa sp. TaxID=1938592 RepID=UPI00262B6FC6|nr:hypothetical protein [Soonwooa sp.]
MTQEDFNFVCYYLTNELKLELKTELPNDVCFAFENEELQDDFKIAFTRKDVELYLIKIENYCNKTSSAKDFITNENSKILLPKSAAIFWNVVKFNTLS